MKTQQENAGVKILVVEDSRTQAEYLCHILENEGYQVIVAANGKDALEQIRIDRPTIVLTDIVMPEMDGYALCRAIRQNGSMARIPVILVTQLFDPADVIRGLEAGASNFIIKPFEPSHVTSRITSILQSLAQTDSDDAGAAREVSFAGDKRIIPGNELQKPAPVPGTYDPADRKNAELQEAHERLTVVNEELQQTVEELQQANENLRRENTERQRIEAVLAKENKKLQIIESFTRDNMLNRLTAMHECLDLANTLRENDPATAWEHIIKAEVLVNHTLKTLR
jgi:DNA-binding response OmpR family regulator